MTDRYSGFVVALNRDMREDDAEATIAAIRQIRGVVDVEPVVADEPTEHINRMRLRREMTTAILDWLEKWE